MNRSTIMSFLTLLNTQIDVMNPYIEQANSFRSAVFKLPKNNSFKNVCVCFIVT